MASITKGQTFGTTEQITNTKLHNLVDLATVDMTTGVAIGTTSPSTGAFSSLTATAAGFPSVTATAIDVVGLNRCDSFRVDQAPLTASASAQQVPFTCDAFFNLSLNGVTYYIPCASATA